MPPPVNPSSVQKKKAEGTPGSRSGASRPQGGLVNPGGPPRLVGAPDVQPSKQPPVQSSGVSRATKKDVEHQDCASSESSDSSEPTGRNVPLYATCEPKTAKGGIVNGSIMPYASENFGVYQPLIGWRSQLQHERLSQAVTSRVVQATTAISRIPDVPPRLVPGNQLVDRTGTNIGRGLVRLSEESDDQTIVQLLADDSNEAFKKLVKDVTQGGNKAESRISRMSGHQIVDEEASALNPAVDTFRAFETEVNTANVLQYLSQQAPNAVTAMFRPSVTRLDRLVSAAKFYTDPHQAKDTFLSPIGTLHLFREYFFELGSFLGPPVGHVWISPGGTVELVEANTRRQLVERTTEASTETVTKTELSTTDHDELSDAVKMENATDTKLGASATASGGIGVFQASGTASFNLDTSRKQAQEQTHKKMREQTAKLSSEVRQNYKTTFRTVTETTDTSSRRYVLMNNTQRLVSYELSRKMRKVAVQVQDLGRRLCWQLYVDNPGDGLATAEFCHSTGSEVDPNLKPYERQPYPAAQTKSFSASIPFIQTRGGDSDIEDTYTASPNNREIGVFTPDAGEQNWVVFKHTINLAPTPEGFMLKEVSSLNFHGAQITVDPVIDLDKQNARFTILLQTAKWGETKQIPFEGVVTYDPTPETRAKIDEQNRQSTASYTQQLQHEKEKAFYETLRTRLKLIGQVRQRRQEDLREEERNLIYRHIVTTLYGKKNVKDWDPEDYHVMSELIRYFFDIDSMLYFVAPDWWRPRSQVFKPRTAQVNEQFTSTIYTDPIPADSTRAAAMGGGSNSLPAIRPHYLVTEESAPAPQGASLGWLMQLDGDAHRNAFLNSPWVKAVLPIRPGREQDAIAFMQRGEVAGLDGLEDEYNLDPPEFNGLKLKDVLLKIADQIAIEYEEETKPVPLPGLGGSKNALPTETVFQNGYDPLENGIELGKKGFKVFSEWTEVLPTDQVVATEYSLEGL